MKKFISDIKKFLTEEEEQIKSKLSIRAFNELKNAENSTSPNTLASLYVLRGYITGVYDIVGINDPQWYKTVMQNIDYHIDRISKIK